MYIYYIYICIYIIYINLYIFDISAVLVNIKVFFRDVFLVIFARCFIMSYIKSDSLLHFSVIGILPSIYDGIFFEEIVNTYNVLIIIIYASAILTIIK